MEYFDIPKRGLSSFKVAMFGLAGASYATVIKVTEIQAHDTALTISFYAFAIAIPLLVALAITTDIAEDPHNKRMSLVGFSVMMLLNVGSWAFVLGFTAFLWHYSVSVAITFLVFACAGLIAFIVHSTDLDKANPSQDTEA